MADKPCTCPTGETGKTDELDGVTIPWHTFSCPLHNSDGPRWYVWRDFDEPARLEAGTLADFARSWAVRHNDRHVAGNLIEPIEVRTWDRTYQATITEQHVNAEDLHGTYVVRVDEESVVELIGLAESAAVG